MQISSNYTDTPLEMTKFQQTMNIEGTIERPISIQSEIVAVN